MSVSIVSKSYLLRDALSTCCTQRNIFVQSNCEKICDITDIEQNSVVLLHTGAPASEVQRDLLLLKGMEPALRIILLTEKDATQDLRASFSGRVHAIIPDDRSVNMLISALTVVLEGYALSRSPKGLMTPLAGDTLAKSPIMMNGHVTPQACDMHAVQQTETKTLSPRETTILSRLTSGDSNKDIANGLGISETTVKVQLRTCYQKIGVRNRTQAAIWAVMYL